MVLTSRGEAHAHSAAGALAEILHAVIKPEDGELLGPAPAPLSRIKGRYRYHLTLKAPSLERVARRIEEALIAYDAFRDSYCRQEGISREDISLTVDVDPVSLL
jgi:primosomal protein N' (replication factor Y)